jgi:hypothetical protein
LLSDSRATNAEVSEKTEDRSYQKSSVCSPNPYDENHKYTSISNGQFSQQVNRDEKLILYKSPSYCQESVNSNTSFLGRKTGKNKKENSIGAYSNEIFRISKANGLNNYNLTNDEEDIHKFLECNEKCEETAKMSFDTNFLIESENLFDFNNVNVSTGNVNINNNVNPGQEKEYF